MFTRKSYTTKSASINPTSPLGRNLTSTDSYCPEDTQKLQILISMYREWVLNVFRAMGQELAGSSLYQYSFSQAVTWCYVKYMK